MAKVFRGVRSHLGWAAGGLGALAVLATIASVLIPSLADLLSHSGQVAWGVAALAIAFGVWMYLFAGNRADELADRDSEVAELKDRVADAAALPSVDDQRQFAELLADWPLTSGSLFWLREVFNAKAWTDRQIDPFYDFCHEWDDRFFDNSQCNDAFRDLYEAVKGLTRWCSRWASPSSADYPAPASTDDDRVLSVIRQEKFKPGYQAWDKMVDDGLTFATIVLEKRRQFERVGRSQGLATLPTAARPPSRP